MVGSIVGDCYINEASSIAKVKNYSECFLYSKGDYERGLVDFVLHSTYLDKSNEGYKELVGDVKRQKFTNSLAKMLESNNCILCVNEKPMPRAFKVFVAKDLKGDKTSLKLFIDVSGLVNAKGVKYTYRMGDLNKIISYLLAGMNSMIYFVMPEKIINNSVLMRDAATCFSSMMYYIIDYLRLSSDNNTRGRMLYLASKYFYVNMLKKSEDTVDNECLKISGISSVDAEMIWMKIKTPNPFQSISTFTRALSEYFGKPELAVDVIVDKWMYSFGSGSQFGLELYPAFANMIIYAYVGAYLNNQKTIEKLVGKNMVPFVNRLMGIGAELI